MALTVRHVGEAQPRPERTRDRELELQRQRRTGARSIFASRIVGSPAPVTPNRSTVFASGCVSTWIRKRTVKQHPCSLFFTFSPLSVFFAFPSFVVQILMWARGAVFLLSRSRRWRAAGEYSVYIDVGGLSPSDTGSWDEGGMLFADGCSRQGNGSVTRAGRGVSAAADSCASP